MWLLWLTACTFVTDAEWAGRKTACETEGRYLDLDGDGHGKQPVRTCEEIEGSVDLNDDCNDADAGIHPGAEETWYDGIDADCNEDDDYDQDADGYVSARFGGDDCYDDGALDDIPQFEGDCDVAMETPLPAEVHPGATDAPYDGVDANCSGGTDFDADADGYRSCDECDDTTATVNPSASETWYDLVDQDCDGNDGDQDGDGFYAADYPGEVPAGREGDCDDTNRDVSPAAEELWYDGTDGDCAGDDDWDQDADGSRTSSRVDDEGNVGGDCDDTDPTRGPSIAEACATSTDDDCDGEINEHDAVGCAIWYADVDADGLGNESDLVCACDAGGNYTAASAGDCDDRSAPVGMLSWYADTDGDGWGAGAAVSVCTAPAGHVAASGDCDDSVGSSYPGATEACDSVDSDCDGSGNDAEVLASCTTNWYADLDGDGYAGSSACLCVAEAPYTSAAADDCDDGASGVSPGAAEVCNDGLDDDCDGLPGSCSFAGTLTNADANLWYYGPSAYDRLGSGVAAPGDLDGDGLDELLVGADGYDDGGGIGLAALVRPLYDSEVDVGPISVVGASSAANFGTVFLAAGDVDLDGQVDLLFGEPNSSDPASSGFRRFSAPTGGFRSATTADLSVSSGDASLVIGGALGVVDDTDSDGAAELLVGVHRHPDHGDGRVVVVPGEATGSRLLSELQSALVYANWGDSAFGASITTGDLDGDGVTDAIVGAPELDYGYADNGALVYVSGPFIDTRAMSDCSGIVYGNDSSEALGDVAPLITDLDGDGANEVVAASTRAGAGVYVFPGVLSASAAWAGTAFESQLLDPAGGSEFGASLSAGDLDGDGAAEIAVGAPAYGGTGAVWVFAGPVSYVSLTTAAASASLTGSASSRFGASVAILGDADGDGFGDLAVGAPYDASAAPDAGAIWFFSGGGY
jgi:hypothetical protein